MAQIVNKTSAFQEKSGAISLDVSQKVSPGSTHTRNPQMVKIHSSDLFFMSTSPATSTIDSTRRFRGDLLFLSWQLLKSQGECSKIWKLHAALTLGSLSTFLVLLELLVCRHGGTMHLELAAKRQSSSGSKPDQPKPQRVAHIRKSASQFLLLGSNIIFGPRAAVTPATLIWDVHSRMLLQLRNEEFIWLD